MHCSNCNSPVPSEAKFCGSCGAKIEQTITQEQPIEVTAAPETGVPHSAPQETAESAAPIQGMPLQEAAVETAASAAAPLGDSQEGNGSEAVLEAASAPVLEPVTEQTAAAIPAAPSAVPVVAPPVVPVMVAENGNFSGQPAMPTETANVSKFNFLQFLNRYKLIIGGVLGAAVVVLAVVFIVLPMLSSKDKQDPVVFFGKNEILMKLENEKEPIELTSKLVEGSGDDEDWGSESIFDKRFLMQGLVQLNDAKDKMFFIKRIKDDDTATLYYRDLNKKASSFDEDEQGIKLASNITGMNYKAFIISGDGKTVLYVKGNGDDESGKLYVHNLSEETLVDNDVTNYWYSDDKSAIFYTKVNDGETDLYVAEKSKLENKTKIDSDIADVEQFDGDSGDIYYTKQAEDEEKNSLTLYAKKYGKDKEKLVSDIDSIESGIIDNSFYYKVAVEKEVALSSLVEDDMAAGDANLTEPAMEDFQTIEQMPYTDWWTGETYYEDVVNTDYDAYYDASDRYYEKQQRDQMRQELSEAKYTDVSYTLYLFTDGKGNKITDDYSYATFVDVSKQTIFYNKNDRKEMKKVLLSEIDYVDEVSYAYSDNISASSLTYLAKDLKGDITFLEDDVSLYSPALSSDNKTLYAIEMNEEEDRELVSFEMVDGKPTNRKSLDEDVDSFTYISDKSLLFYYKEVNDNGIGELYQLADGKKSRIAIDVKQGYSSYFKEDGTLFYVIDYDKDNGSGTLVKSKDGKADKIANEVGDYYYLGPSALYYLGNYDYERGYGELMKAANKDKEQDTLIHDRVYTMYQSDWGYQF